MEIPKRQKITVLDDGFVSLVDFMGQDIDIVNAARISYGEESKEMLQKDTNLLNYLMAHKHTTPFEMCQIKFHIRCPMDVWRQWIRHRTASVNEYSTRYSGAIDSAHKTNADRWREQSTTNRQGSGDALPLHTGKYLSSQEAELQIHARAVYEERIATGVAREQARKDLPLSTYTEAFWCINLHNLLNFLRLRLAPDAQYEIRSYANAVASIVKDLYPVTWQAFNNHVLHSVTLSEKEQEMFRTILYRMNERTAMKMGGLGLTKRKWAELSKKLKALLPLSMYEYVREVYESTT